MKTIYRHEPNPDATASLGTVTLKQLQDAVAQIERCKIKNPEDFEFVCSRDTARSVTAHTFGMTEDDAGLDVMVDRLWDKVDSL